MPDGLDLTLVGLMLTSVEFLPEICWIDVCACSTYAFLL